MFQLGDIVQLKSGGPRMTVEEIEQGDGYNLVGCVWFEKHTAHRQSFNPVLLAKAGSGFAIG